MTPTIRPATAADVDRIGDIMYDPPTGELLGIVGDPGRAERFGRGMLALQHLPNPGKPTFVAEIDGRVAGFLQCTSGSGSTGARGTWREWLLAVRVAGPIGVARAIPRLRARIRVDIPTPAGAFYIAELHIDPDLRGQGIGGALLDFADREACNSGIRHLALHTHTTNRARNLYERHGYRVTQVREDPGYERYTGISGRILMEKWLR
jgi:ribosomal protein S18 acetylase RimI-like enzyme